MVEWYVNALFELFAAVFVFVSVVKCYRDGSTKGVSLWTPGFFAMWGLWNLWYYPAVGDMLSFYAGMGVAAANLSWTGLIFYTNYVRKED
jgi:hypothetical protein